MKRTCGALILFVFSTSAFAANHKINAQTCENPQPWPGSVSDANGNPVDQGIYCYPKGNLASVENISSATPNSYEIKFDKDFSGGAKVVRIISKSSAKLIDYYNKYNLNGWVVEDKVKTKTASTASCEVISSDAVKYKGQIYLKSEAQPVDPGSTSLESGTSSAQ